MPPPPPTPSSTYSYSSTTIAVGIDLGSANARIATYDTNLNHPVVCANHDGHRETKVLWSAAAADSNNNNNNNDVEQQQQPELAKPVTTIEHLRGFYQDKLLALATSSAHTKDLHVVVSVSNDPTHRYHYQDKEWLPTLRSLGCSVITEAAAVCLAYQVDPKEHSRVLVLDGGASSLKGTILVAVAPSSSSSSSCSGGGGGGLWRQEHFAKLDTVNGPSLVEPLAQAVAQQFEQKCRLPRGEVWQSKKARAKLLKACEESLSSFQRLQNVAIHVDGLYEGMDCNVTISKPKWEHLSSALANQVKAFCKEELLHLPQGIDTVLVAGNMHDWMMPIVKSTVGVEKLHPATGTLDPSEAIAMGCTLQSYWNLQRQLQLQQQQQQQQQLQEDDDDGAAAIASSIYTSHVLDVPCSPVSIGIQQGDGTDNNNGDNTIIWIAQGTPLPCQVTHQVQTDALELLQFLHPTPTTTTTTTTGRPLAKLEELDATAPTKIHLQLSALGRLRIQVNDGESIVIG